MGIWLSIVGMYEFDPTIFDDLDVPTYTDDSGTVHVVDKQKVINSILLNCAELEIIYSSIDTMKLAIGVWSASEFDTWSKMFETQKVKYNPLWNVDANVENVNSVMGFNKDTDWSNATKTEVRRTGNIGVTSSMELIRQQREVADFSIIRYITESFKKRFCILIY